MILLGKVHVFTYTVQPTDLQRLEIGDTNGRRHKGTSGGNGCEASGALVGGDK